MRESGIVRLGSGIVVERRLRRGRLVIKAYTQDEWASKQRSIITKIKSIWNKITTK